jgi:ABC-type transporter Mla subunit MlaD
MLDSQKEILKVGEALSTHFSSLSDAIENLISWHNRVKDGLSQQIGALMGTVEALNDVADRMKMEQKTSLDIVQSLANTQTNLNPAADSLKGAGEAVKKASDSLFGTQKELRALGTKMRDAANELTDRQIQALDQYNEIQKSLKKIMDKR